MDAAELSGLVAAYERRRQNELRDLYRANEYLAFNTAALCLAAFNAPQQFPSSLSAAFPQKRCSWQSAKEEFLEIAKAFSQKSNI